MFLLDTNVVSELRKRKPAPQMMDWYTRQDARDLWTTVITIFEIQIGIERARRQHPGVAADAERWLEQELLPLFGERILPLSVAASRLYGRMLTTPDLVNFVLQDPRSKKQRTGADLMVAAIALTEGATVVTRDTDDFRRISQHFPLPGLLDPFQVPTSESGGPFERQTNEPFQLSQSL